MISTISFTKLAFLAFVSVFINFTFEYPSFSQKYTQNQNTAKKEETDNSVKLNKPNSAKNTKQPPSKDMKGSMAVSEDGCITKTLRLRNGVNLKIKQGCR